MTIRSSLSSSSSSSSCATAALLRLLVAATMILLHQNQPVVSAMVATATACERIVLMSTNDVLMAGQRRTNAQAGLHLDLQPNGDLQLWRDVVGPETNFETTSALVWSSGGIINDPMTNVTTTTTTTTTVYQTVMQNDGRLVTFGVNSTSRQRLDTVWMTNAYNSVGPAYSLAVDCRNGIVGAGNIGIVRGPPQQAHPETIWTADTLDVAATAAAAAIDAQTPLVEDTANTTGGLGGCTTTTNATILMKSGDFMYSGKRVVVYDRGVYLHQKETGQLELRVGTPENPGRLLWESGWAMTAVTGEQSSFYTKFESTSNLVTWKANPADNDYEVVWETATFRPTDIYYLVLDCWNRIAVYQGHPHNDGVVVWTAGTTASESAGAEILPIPRPTAPPTDAPTRPPAAVVDELVVDPTGAPTTRPSSTITETNTGTSGASATATASTTGSTFVLTLLFFALF